MRPLPKVPFAGRLCRIRIEEPLDAALKRLARPGGAQLEIIPIENTGWSSCWFHSTVALVSNSGAPEPDGTYPYPFLIRASEDKYIVLSKEAALVDQIFERAGVGGHVQTPRILVDRLARDLISPPAGTTTGRRYMIGSVYASVEGYARTLRTISLFGDDLAEAELFRYALQQSTVTRIGVRDPRSDKDLLSVGAAGTIDLHFRSAAHLNAIDQFTRFLRAGGYIEWRRANTWAPDLSPSKTQNSGDDRNF